MNDPKVEDRLITSVVLQSGNQIIPEKNLPPDLYKLVKQVFIQPNNWTDGVFRSPLAAVSEYLVSNGVSQANLRAGLLTYLALNSVNLGHPMSIILRTEEMAVASHLLMVCRLIAPRNSFREVRELKAEQLYGDHDFFRNKVLIFENVASIRKALPDLISLITQGRVVRQSDYKSKYGSGVRSFTAGYPVAIIGVENSDDESVINHPSVLKVPVHGNDSTQTCFESSQSLELVNDSEMIERRCIATQFERLIPRRVSIPYFGGVIHSVMDERPANLKVKLSVIKKTIDLCAIINDPPEMSSEEVFLRTIGMELSGLQKFSEETKAIDVHLPVLSESISASLADYYIAKILLKNLLDVGNQSFNIKQVKVFEVIRTINYGKLVVAAINQDDTIEKLALLPRFPQYWAYMHEIMKGVNKDKSEFMSGPDIEDVIRSLKKNKKVGAKKSQATGDCGYFILVPKIDGRLKLSSVSKIKESLYSWDTAKILNPITGEIEEI